MMNIKQLVLIIIVHIARVIFKNLNITYRIIRHGNLGNYFSVHLRYNL